MMRSRVPREDSRAESPVTSMTRFLSRSEKNREVPFHPRLYLLKSRVFAERWMEARSS
jgi:hypothetical protein